MGYYLQHAKREADTLIDNLAQTNPIAFQSYNARAAMPYLDLLETVEQKEKFQLRVMQRTTPLTPEAADVLIKQITSPTAQNEVKLQDQLKLLQQLNEQINPLETLKMTGRLSDDGKAMLSILTQERSNVLQSIKQKEALDKATTVTNQPILGGANKATTVTDKPIQGGAEQSQKPIRESKLTADETLARTASLTPLENIGSRIFGIGQSIGDFFSATSQQLGIIQAASGKLQYEVENQENKTIDQLIDTYNKGLTTRDEMESGLKTIVTYTNRPYIDIAGFITAKKFIKAREIIKDLPFSREEIVKITKLSNSKVAQAFRAARKSLSEKSRNDINDITVLVNRTLGTKYTSRDLVDALLQEIGVIK